MTLFYNGQEEISTDGWLGWGNRSEERGSTDGCMGSTEDGMYQSPKALIDHIDGISAEEGLDILDSAVQNPLAAL